jgi:hypothetical protein
MASLNLSVLQNACDFLTDTINRANSKDKSTWKEDRCLYCQEEIDIRAVANGALRCPWKNAPSAAGKVSLFILYNNDDGEFGCASCGYVLHVRRMRERKAFSAFK